MRRKHSERKQPTEQKTNKIKHQKKHFKHNTRHKTQDHQQRFKQYTKTDKQQQHQHDKMSEGGYFPWKRQAIKNKPTADYSNLSNPLPELPKGQSWVRDPQTREWSINCKCVDEENVVQHVQVAVGIPVNIDLDEKKKVLPENCDFLLHYVQPSDTLQGLCLRYGITPLSLRQVNKFSGSNLIMAPKTLIIPLTRQDNKATTFMNEKEVKNDKDAKINQFLFTFRNNQASSMVGRKEALAYLDMNDGNLEMAIQDAKDDFGWELGEGETSNLL